MLAIVMATPGEKTAIKTKLSIANPYFIGHGVLFSFPVVLLYH